MRDVIDLLTVGDELQDVHAAEEAIHAKNRERDAIKHQLHNEVLGKDNLELSV
jgi:hypothetical protein